MKFFGKIDFQKYYFRVVISSRKGRQALCMQLASPIKRETFFSIFLVKKTLKAFFSKLQFLTLR